MFTIPVATNQTVGLRMTVHVEVADATPHNCSTIQDFYVAVQNTGGTITQQTTANTNLATICDTGTLTIAVASTTASSPVTINVTPTWSLTAAGSIITVAVENLSQQTLTALSD
jgi:hypothetical protein